MQPPVAVLERVDMDKPEGRGRGLENRVDAVVAHAVVGFQHAGHQVGQILRARANELGQRIAKMVALAQEHATWTKARMHEAGVLDEDVVQPDDFTDGELVLSGLQDGTPPTLQSVARGALSFNLEAGVAVGE